MAGILDNKKRIMDTIVTQEGRRQLSSGNFKIKYASFTDGNVFYEGDNETGTTDATLRVPFEALNKYQDSIIIESDDSGNLLNFQGNGVDLTPDGSIAIEDSELDDPSSIRRVVSTPAAFSSAVDIILSSTFDSFENQNFITTRDDRNSKSFSVTQNIDSFDYTIGSGYDNEVIKSRVLDTLPAFIHDVKLSGIPNFKFLPPINQNDKTLNGTYADLNDEHGLSANKIKKMTANKQDIKLKVTSSQQKNKLLIQLFENSNDSATIKKLDVIDAGSFNIENQNKKIYFIGKVMIDSHNQPTFVNMFTLEMTSDN